MAISDTAATPPADMSLDLALVRVEHWITGAIRLLPNILVAVVIMLLFWGLSLLARRLIIRQLGRADRENLGDVLGGFIRWVVLIAGFLLAATVVIPTLHPGDLIAGLGVSSIAIGFAFKDILQNWLAGLLLLLRQPFQTNDQIEVNGFEGTVQRIETRATIIRTYDGQRVVIPNSDIYTNAVLVKTAHEKRRSQYDIGIGYGDDLDAACDVIRRALATVDEIEADPAPEALPWELAASSVNIRARWWTDSRRADVVKVRAQVIPAVKKALDAAGIDMPYDTEVQLVHDQTEVHDGNRAAQREGWPAATSGPTEPRWQAQRSADTPATPDT
ncbi:mechanosensitive ion channel family protein [Salinisphaera sp. T31B1]|uniref:mechanosensitive ion channel family protein n=1 Tax=Salinisphaera sp. T31B1 TaxID=727963 RepID=UPI003342D135